MNLKYGKNKRKAISPVLATVILIAITLIAAIAIAGFVFGLFGSFTSTAQVSVTQTSLAAANWNTASEGTIIASNTGTANTAINSMTMTFGGQTCVPVGLTAGTAVKAGSSATITLTAKGTCTATPTSGEQFTGSLALSNGGSVQYTGTFQ